jgi:hypothetical protein
VAYAARKEMLAALFGLGVATKAQPIRDDACVNIDPAGAEIALLCRLSRKSPGRDSNS